MLDSFTLSVVVQLLSRVWLYDPMDCSALGFSFLHGLLDFAQTHVHWGDDAIQPSHLLSPPSPAALSLSQHQGLFQWVGSLHQVAKVLELQLQHQFFQWLFRGISFRMDMPVTKHPSKSQVTKWASRPWSWSHPSIDCTLVGVVCHLAWPPGESGPGIFGTINTSPNEMDGDSAAIISWKLLASLWMPLSELGLWLFLDSHYMALMRRTASAYRFLSPRVWSCTEML